MIIDLPLGFCDSVYTLFNHYYNSPFFWDAIVLDLQIFIIQVQLDF